MKVKINGKKQDSIQYKCYFSQKDNFVELIREDNIDNCNYMFRKCSSITEIDLSNFKTSQVTAMNSMFSYCSSLTSLDLSNFDTSQVETTSSMFFHCSNLQYINLNNFDESKLNDVRNMFENVPDDVVICMKEINTQSKIYSQLNSNQKA